MHPGFMHWWSRRGEHGCGSAEGHVGGHCGPGHASGGPYRGSHERFEASGPHGHGGDADGGGFGVRRPLRFLAWKLELDEPQVEKLARVLDELKIERAQAAVDARRASAALADAVEGETLDTAALERAAKARTESADRLARAVTTALGRIHELLAPKQRTQLAYLIRTGTISM